MLQFALISGFVNRDDQIGSGNDNSKLSHSAVGAVSTMRLAHPALQTIAHKIVCDAWISGCL